MKRLCCWLLIFLLLTGCGLGDRTWGNAVPGSAEGLEVHFLDVGQADCVLLRCSEHNMLIDGGNVADSDLVVSYLQDLGIVKLDLVVNTHAHEDHVGGLPAVLAVYETETLWCPVTAYDSKCFRDFLYYADQQELEPMCPNPGRTYRLGDTVITVLGPVRDDYDTNNSSIVLRADYGDTAFLFSGDAEREAESDILDAGFSIGCTVMKAGHHGSDTSNSYRWLREAGAEAVIISVGEGNSYGHPHKEPMSRFRDADMTVYRTDLQGHIVCRSDGKTVSVETQRQAAVTNPTAVDGSGTKGEITCLIGNRNSKKYHLPTCSGLPDEKNRVFFSAAGEAEASGFTPCGTCLP